MLIKYKLMYMVTMAMATEVVEVVSEDVDVVVCLEEAEGK